MDKERESIFQRLSDIDTRTNAQNERLIRAEESFRFIAQELARIVVNVDLNNRKLDKLLAQNN